MHFLALHRAGVTEVGGRPTLNWYERCRHSVRTSGLPDRLRPGFWDNDGRCCGTAGVGDSFLDAWTRDGDDADLAFAVRLGDALVERACEADGRAYWRFASTARARRSYRPGSGGCRGPPASPPTSSGCPGWRTESGRRPPSPGWRAGGLSRRPRRGNPGLSASGQR